MRLILLSLLLSPSLLAQFDQLSQSIARLGRTMPVEEIVLRPTPEGDDALRVRPLETLTVQVLAYGLHEDRKVRLRRGEETKIRVKEENGGWLSKPFASQIQDNERYFEETSSRAFNIFADASARFVVKDSFLYTAPEEPGRYTIEAELEGKQATIEVEVSEDAPSRRVAETVSFEQAAPSRDPYRPLAEHYAPFVAQETWFQPKSDIPVRFDFDGDWHGDNNWEQTDIGSSQAYVYYAVMETETHWFVQYNLFHSRDYSDRCVVGTCHENDNEGIILTVRKDGTQFGTLQAMETLAHNNIYTFTNDRSLRNGAHTIDGGIELYEGSHPAIFIESGGHGIYGTTSSHSRFTLKEGEYKEGTGNTFIYKGVAERARHANERLVGYDLLPIYEEWWLKAEEGKWDHRTFDDYYLYQPFGGRPGVAVQGRIGGTFLGRTESANKAKPFWGWHDSATLRRRILAVGQWGLDPAYATSQNIRFPANQPFSLEYIYNPYLGIDRRPDAPAPEPAPEPGPTPEPEPEPLAPGILDPDPVAEPAPTRGRVEIEAVVDGTVEIRVSGDEVGWRVRSGAPVSRERSQFSSPLPAEPLASVTLVKQAGRGSARLTERPSEANGYTAVIRVEDPRPGADFFRLLLEWSR
ncbi:MAG: hypothetical protein ACK5AZ_13670 [Bryobacteraceae bacterium]